MAVVDPFTLARHLDDRHGVDWADVMDKDEMDNVHFDVHSRRRPHGGKDPGHDHDWNGKVADPQPPLSDNG